MDVQTISIVVAAAGVFIAAINSIYASRRAEEQRQLTLEAQQEALETRQAQLFMQVYNRWSTKEVANAYIMLRDVYRKEDIEALIQDIRGKRDFDLDQATVRQMMATYFEGLGMLVKQGLINIELVEDLFAGRIIWYWETQIQPYADNIRKHQDDPNLYDSIEYLYDQIKQRDQQTTVTT